MRTAVVTGGMSGIGAACASRLAAGGVKDRVMGAASDASDAVADKASSVAGQAGNVNVKGRTQGNPLAAGLIAFGAGLLVSSLIPSSQKEQQAVSDLQAKAAPLQEKAKEAAQEVAGNLKEPVQEAEFIEESGRHRWTPGAGIRPVYILIDESAEAMPQLDALDAGVSALLRTLKRSPEIAAVVRLAVLDSLVPVSTFLPPADFFAFSLFLSRYLVFCVLGT